MLTGTNSKHTKVFNHRIVLETIRLHAPLSRADIARRTTLTAQTVSNIVAALLDDNLIREVDERRQGPGARSIPLAIAPEGAYSIGLDLDRDHLTGVIIDLSGAVRQRLHYELSYPDPEEATSLMVDTVRILLDQESLPADEVRGVGVGFPGPIKVTTENEGTAVRPKAFPGWDDVPLIDLLRDRIDRPMLLENNATAAAVGEHWYGGGTDVSTFFYLLLGVGLGGGLIINGYPYGGHTGNTGELGCIPVSGEAPFSCTGSPNHLGEHYHLPRLYEQLRRAGIDVTAPAQLAAPFHEDSSIVLEWLDALADRLAPVLVSVECLLDPEKIVFGGRLPDVLVDALLDRLDDRLPALRTEGVRSNISLERAAAGENAAALGVATLPMYTFFAPTPRLVFQQQSPQMGTLLS